METRSKANLLAQNAYYVTRLIVPPVLVNGSYILSDSDTPKGTKADF